MKRKKQLNDTNRGKTTGLAEQERGDGLND